MNACTRSHARVVNRVEKSPKESVISACEDVPIVICSKWVSRSAAIPSVPLILFFLCPNSSLYIIANFLCAGYSIFEIMDSYTKVCDDVSFSCGPHLPKRPSPTDIDDMAGGACEGVSFTSVPCKPDVGKAVALRTEGIGPAGAASGEESS